MAISPRSQIIQAGDTARLSVRFNGYDGRPADLDLFPNVTIISPNGSVVVGPTSVGVSRIGIGEYSFDYSVGLFPPIGVWVDRWQGTLEGMTVSNEFTFQVNITQTPAINTDGYVHLGDDPGYCFSQTAICNINHLMKSLRARLKDQGKKSTVDEFGNTVYKDCSVYSPDQLVAFIGQALSMFNEIPHFTTFSFEDTPIIELFHNVLVEGATLIALSSQALIERGREFQIQDNGLGFTPPTVSELLNSQWSTALTHWWEKVKMIKASMKPGPIGLGVMSFTAGASPQFRRLRTLRARQIY